MKINPEILSVKPTHFDKQSNRLVKVFENTAQVNSFTAEIMEGEHKGKWTTVYAEHLIDIHQRNAELLSALRMIDECLSSGIPIEKNDPIHKQIKKLIL